MAAASCRHGAMFQGSHNTFSVHESDRSERSFIYCSLRYKLRFHDLDVILWAQSSHNLPLFLIGSHVPGQFVLGSPSVCTEAPSGLSLVIFYASTRHLFASNLLVDPQERYQTSR